MGQPPTVGEHSFLKTKWAIQTSAVHVGFQGEGRLGGEVSWVGGASRVEGAGQLFSLPYFLRGGGGGGVSWLGVLGVGGEV